MSEVVSEPEHTLSTYFQRCLYLLKSPRGFSTSPFAHDGSSEKNSKGDGALDGRAVSMIYISGHSSLNLRLSAPTRVPGISAVPHEDNLRYFDVTIDGPSQSPYEGSILLASDQEA